MPETLPGPLQELLGPTIAFALIRREGRDQVEVFTGETMTVPRLTDIPLRDGAPAGPQVLALVPHRQVAERGFDCVDDGAPLQCLQVSGYATVAVDELLAALPAQPTGGIDGAFDLDDAEYADAVRAVLRDEIGRGEGANFVLHRTFLGTVQGSPLDAALAAFGRLLSHEQGAYWTFCVHIGGRTFVGATPERHVSVADGLVMMNPISGTYRNRADAAELTNATGLSDAAGLSDATGRVAQRDGLLQFLADRKEVEELCMVLDEELKMMATVTDRGGQVLGPYLKEMAHLTHTEYLLVGHAARDVREVLRDTMFAPTVIGSPLQNACRVIARHERRGRGYYGGVLALLGTDDAGRQTLDAPILIRTAVIDHSGELRVPVGATLVRHSTPDGEVAETYTKAAGVLSALGLGVGLGVGLGLGADGSTMDKSAGRTLATDPEVRAVLRRRNDTLARFWLDAREADAPAGAPEIAGRSALVIDNEDTFTGMLAHQLRSLGLTVALRPHHEPGDLGGYDLVVAGPGPGDPTGQTDPKMQRVRHVVAELLQRRQPLLAVCLGHQVLASTLGLRLRRKRTPYQGLQREIDFFGRPERVAFYCTFTAQCGSDLLATRYGAVQLSRDRRSGEVHALRAATFAGVQFHPESVLSEHGVQLIRELVVPLLVPPRFTLEEGAATSSARRP